MCVDVQACVIVRCVLSESRSLGVGGTRHPNLNICLRQPTGTFMSEYRCLERRERRERKVAVFLFRFVLFCFVSFRFVLFFVVLMFMVGGCVCSVVVGPRHNIVTLVAILTCESFVILRYGCERLIEQSGISLPSG